MIEREREREREKGGLVENMIMLVITLHNMFAHHTEIGWL